MRAISSKMGEVSSWIDWSVSDEAQDERAHVEVVESLEAGKVSNPSVEMLMVASERVESEIVAQTVMSEQAPGESAEVVRAVKSVTSELTFTPPDAMSLTLGPPPEPFKTGELEFNPRAVPRATAKMIAWGATASTESANNISSSTIEKAATLDFSPGVSSASKERNVSVARVSNYEEETVSSVDNWSDVENLEQLNSLIDKRFGTVGRAAANQPSTRRISSLRQAETELDSRPVMAAQLASATLREVSLLPAMAERKYRWLTQCLMNGHTVGVGSRQSGMCEACGETTGAARGYAAKSFGDYVRQVWEAIVGGIRGLGRD